MKEKSRERSVIEVYLGVHKVDNTPRAGEGCVLHGYTRKRFPMGKKTSCTRFAICFIPIPRFLPFYGNIKVTRDQHLSADRKICTISLAIYV